MGDVTRSIKAAIDLDGREHRERFFDSLYREYARPLLRFISRQNIGREDAREIVQETYCRLHQVPQVESLESPRGYLFRTAINLARDSKRLRRREFHVADAGQPGAADAVDVPSEAPTAYQVLKGQQELEIIRQAIAELSPTCRQVFIMHRFGGATYAQIADRHGLSVSMIEKHVSHALVHLKTRLDAANASVKARKAGP
jgi:RNA polymerase sigma-70 factor (ECF subfamily)